MTNPTPQQPRRRSRGAIAAVLPILLAGLVPLALAGCDQGAGGSSAEEPPLAGAAIGGPFTLEDKNGKTVHWSDFAGKYRIVYFGYTFCPDACPTDMAALMKGYDLFARQSPQLAAKVQPIFISIDPARDTPAIVGQWTAAFSPRLLGLTGSPEQVAKAAKEFAASYSKGDETDGGYLMNHTRMAYLMDPKGAPVALLPVDGVTGDGGKTDPGKAVAAELAKWVT